MMHAYTFLCSVGAESELVDAVQFLMEEGEHFGADELTGLRIAMEDAEHAIFPTSKGDTVDLRARIKSRNGTTSRKVLPTFTASEDYLTIRD